jgi:hypothetical protein
MLILAFANASMSDCFILFVANLQKDDHSYGVRLKI